MAHRIHFKVFSLEYKVLLHTPPTLNIHTVPLPLTNVHVLLGQVPWFFLFLFSRKTLSSFSIWKTIHPLMTHYECHFCCEAFLIFPDRLTVPTVLYPYPYYSPYDIVFHLCFYNMFPLKTLSSQKKENMSYSTVCPLSLAPFYVGVINSASD